MKPLLTFFAVFAAFCAGGILYCNYFNNLIVCKTDEITTERMPFDENGEIKFSREFKLSNYGFTTIEFKKFQASCGCTNITLPKKLKPFSSVKLRADVEYSAKELRGKKVDIVVLSSAKNGTLTLKLTSEPMDYWYYKPNRLQFGSVYKSEPIKGEIVFVAATPMNKTPSVTIGGIPASLKVSSRTEDKGVIKYSDGSESKVTVITIGVEVSDTDTDGAHMETFRATLHAAGDYEVVVPVSWSIKPPASFGLPAYTCIGDNRIIPIILTFDERTKRPESISVSDPNFKIDTEKDFKGGKELQVSFNGDEADKSSATLTAVFSDGTKISAELNHFPSGQGD